MTTYILTKGKDQIRIRIDGEDGHIVRVVDGNVSTSERVVRAIEANDQVGVLMRQGYKAKKISNEPLKDKHARK